MPLWSCRSSMPHTLPHSRVTHQVMDSTGGRPFIPTDFEWRYSALPHLDKNIIDQLKYKFFSMLAPLGLIISNVIVMLKYPVISNLFEKKPFVHIIAASLKKFSDKYLSLEITINLSIEEVISLCVSQTRYHMFDYSELRYYIIRALKSVVDIRYDLHTGICRHFGTRTVIFAVISPIM